MNHDARILIAESGSGFGGSAKYLASLLPLLNRDKYEIELVAYGSGPFIQDIKQSGWFVHQFSGWRFPHALTERKMGNKIIRIASYFLISILQLMILIPMIAVRLIRNRIRLVHLNNEILSHLPLVLATKLAGCRVVCHFHGWRKLTKTEKWVSQFVDFFISVTQSGADFYSWQLNGKNVVGIPNGLVINEKPETDDNLKARYNMRHQLGLGEDDFLAVLVGRLIPLKGHSVFFQAIERARKDNPNIRALVVGEDPSGNGMYQKKLLTELEALGVRHLVQFLPWQDHMGPVYQASDVVLQPSIEPESFGYVALEGMAAGKPVIASRLGGLMDVVRDGETGFLVEAGNADELSKAMNQIAGNSTLASDFGFKGSQRAKTVFTMTHNAERMTQIYDQLLNPNRILIAESGSGYGGTARYLTHLLSSIDRKRFAVEIVAYGNGPFVKEIERQWPVKYSLLWRYPWGEKDEAWGKVQIGNLFMRWFHYLSSFAISLLQILILVPRIVFWLKRRNIRIVHLNNGIRSHIPLHIAAKLSGCRIICHFHGWRSFTHTEKWLSPWVDQFISISEAGSQFLKNEISNQKVTAIPNGLPTTAQPEISKDRLIRERQLLGISPESKVISIIGRLVEWKGQEIYLHALAKVIKNQSHVVGLILGHDPTPDQHYLKKLQALTITLGISSYVHFLSWQEDVKSIYAISDIVIHASIDPEPFGLVILEAMFSKKPIVATQGGGVTDLIIDGQSGLLVEPNHPDELAAAINKILTDLKLARQLADAAELRARTLFSIERNAAMVQEIYSNLLEEYPEHSALPKSKWRSQVKEIMLKTGTLSLLRNSLSFKIPILMYHKISNEKDPFFPSVSERTFRQQMSYIKQNYQIISMDDLGKSLRLGEKPSRRSIVVTLDDGNMPTLRLAAPIFEEFGIPVTVFLSAGARDANNLIWTDLLRWWLKLTRLNHYSIQLNGHVREWKLADLSERLQAVDEISHKLKLMNNDERKKAIEQLERGLGVKNSDLPQDWLLANSQIKFLSKKQIKFGAHTMTHPILSRMSLEEARYEIFESKHWLENILNEKVGHFAYPNGEPSDFTTEHEKLVAQAGFDSGSSTILGLNDFDTNRYALRRIYAAEESLANFASRLVGIGS